MNVYVKYVYKFKHVCMGECIVCVSGSKLDGQLGMVIVYMFVCVPVLEVWVGAGLLSFLYRKDRNLAGLKSPFAHLVLRREAKQNERHSRSPPLLPISQRYKTVHAKHWWEIKLCVQVRWACVWGSFCYSDKIKKIKNTTATLLLHYMASKINFRFGLTVIWCACDCRLYWKYAC